MENYLTYLYLITPLHTGGSTNEGNMMGIAREVHTEFPYLPASSLRGKIRAELEAVKNENEKKAAGRLFGEKIQNGNQPTEGAIWFADATLLFFPIASLSHHLIWISCPLWLERWNRWLPNKSISGVIETSRAALEKKEDKKEEKSAVSTFNTEKLYLQTALLNKSDLEVLIPSDCTTLFQPLGNLVTTGMLTQLKNKLLILTDEDCAALVEIGLQREVRVALEDNSKTVKGGSFRSEEAIPPEAVLFFPWGMKSTNPPKSEITPEEAEKLKIKGQEETLANEAIRKVVRDKLNARLQFGGLEGLGRGWSELQTINLKLENKK